jgi:septum formation protein
MAIEEIPVYIAKNKAEKVKRSLDITNRQIPILAADTIVVLDKKIIGKPKDRNEAINILTSLSGNKHKVITGVVILSEQDLISFEDTTEVVFHQLAKNEIEFYVDKYEPYDKAGAYAIQEWIGVVGIKSINGDFYNVMGLPVSRVVRELNKLRME